MAAAGAAGLGYFDLVMLVILALLGILFLSYRQTIEAYPSGGGAYTVAKENLGVQASLLAAAAIMIDYVLNVAVGISARVGALVSAIPALDQYVLPLCLGILAVLPLANLRGMTDAGRLFALPTYLFVASFIIILIVGLYAATMSGGHPRPVASPPAPPRTTEAVSLWLLLRAFAAGCTAMTGVEAISNGVRAFRQPRVTVARRTLAIIVVTLAILLGGVAYLTNAYGIMAMDQSQPGYQSVLSQLAGAIVGRGAFYYVAIASTLCILCLSADTSFVGFPQLCRLAAQDGFLPRPFAIAGRRLVFSVGIFFLALTAGALLTAFGGVTNRLIPLFAIGAFLTFTMSQAGMVVHSRRELARSGVNRGQVWLHLCVNATGASTTTIALAVIVIGKFTEGGWITILAIPCVILLLEAIRSFYDELGDQLRVDGPAQFRWGKPPIVLVATQELNRLTYKALSLAMELSHDVMAIHLTALEGPDTRENESRLREEWATDVEKPALANRYPHPPQLVFLSAPYRRIHAPLLKLIKKLQDEHPDRTIAVLVPEIVKRHWWEYLMHSRHAERLRSAVLEYGGSRVVALVVPWHLSEPKIEEAMTEEERVEPFRSREVFGPSGHHFRERRSAKRHP